ncbi:MAG: FHIPEP family type III secretion protein [Treponema sp.]|nr:FHIPEP family type III secretion protein [Treponema sp.]
MTYGKITEPVQVIVGSGLAELFCTAEYLQITTDVEKEIFTKWGVRLNHIHVIFDESLSENQYKILINGNVFAAAELMPERVMIYGFDTKLIDFLDEQKIDYINGCEPAFETKGIFIKKEDSEKVKKIAPRLIKASDILQIHIRAVIENNLKDLISTQVVKEMIDDLKKSDSVLVKEIKTKYEMSYIRKMLQCLLYEKITIKNLRIILEKMADLYKLQDDFLYLKSRICCAISYDICERFIVDGKINCVILSQKTANIINDSIYKIKGEVYPDIDLTRKQWGYLNNGLDENVLRNCATLLVSSALYDCLVKHLKKFSSSFPIVSDEMLLEGNCKEQFSLDILSEIDIDGDTPKEETVISRRRRNKIQRQKEVEKYLAQQNKTPANIFDFSKVLNPTLKEIKERVSICDFIATDNHCAVGICMEPFHMEYFTRNAVPYVLKAAQQKGIKIFETKITSEIFCNNCVSKETSDFAKKLVLEYDKIWGKVE